MKKILVVDDDPDIRYAIKESFFTEYDIISADSGKKCLQILETKNPDAIILDIMMPDMDGWETFTKIRERSSFRNTPIIFLTARRDDTAKKAGCVLGDDYIEKPFEINDLKSRIEKIFKNRK